MNIVFTGGGTGGHLYPAIAVARAIKSKYPDSRILFIGNKDGVEASIVPREGFDIKFVSCSSFSSNPVKLAKGIVKIAAGIAKTLSIFSEFKPDIVTGSGGYVSAPVTMAAFLKKIPVVLLEQNTISGKTNRLVGKIAKKICISFEGSASSFPKEKTVLTGNPVRDDIIEASRQDARKRLGIPEDRKCLLITGASQGARSINEAIASKLPSWKDLDMTIIHITGEKNIEEAKKAAEAVPKGSCLDYRPLPFMDNIADAYASCDLAAARAGATTLAELTARGIPSILIPYPHAAEDHQRKNAEFIASKGAALTIEDSEAMEKLGDTIEKLFNDRAGLERMAECSRKLGRPSAVFEILKVLEGLK
ncbi:MAG: undecaprenyldiphospho-muramoylpentapeptide beta-N-acetylglucosaminyltransferase [bacterium]|nr:undecaprenyldiphospho-muramoylpentapeptide beta-N-acetylglucosaminyltransferase [bacterium]